jgi:hypothetical protein
MIRAVSREKGKQELFTDFFVRYHNEFGAACSAAATESWQSIITLRGSLVNVPLSALNDKLEDYLEAAYNLGKIAAYAEVLKELYGLELANDYLNRPKVLVRLQKLAFELYWLSLRLEKSRLRRNESLAQKAARLDYAFYRITLRALKAAKAGLPKS